MSTRIFGDVPGYPEGSLFLSRQNLSSAGIHRPTQAGISGSGDEGADSIVLSGGYEDDEDYGDIIVYTGHGGRHPATTEQISDQLLVRGNLALAHSCLNGLPVRVIRGSSHPYKESPPHGYRYDGLYRVESYWRDTGRSGYTIWRFRLIKLDSGREERELQFEPLGQVNVTIQRVIRDTHLGKMVKKIYDYQCQVCGIRLVGSAGPYAEAAHIRPLGTPHNGPDSLENLICLCPNHHVLLDYGGFAILDDLTLVGIDGRLKVRPEHALESAHLQYRRAHFYKGI